MAPGGPPGPSRDSKMEVPSEATSGRGLEHVWTPADTMKAAAAAALPPLLM